MDTRTGFKLVGNNDKFIGKTELYNEAQFAAQTLSVKHKQTIKIIHIESGETIATFSDGALQ